MKINKAKFGGNYIKIVRDQFEKKNQSKSIQLNLKKKNIYKKVLKN